MESRVDSYLKIEAFVSFHHTHQFHLNYINTTLLTNMSGYTLDKFMVDATGGKAIGAGGAYAPPKKEESNLVGKL